MDVDTTNNRDVWLVKVPKYLANAWKNAPQRAELGKLQLPKNNSGPVKFIIDPKLQQQQASKLPAEHLLTLNPLNHQRMVILAQTKDSQTTNSGSNNNSSTNSALSSANAIDKISFEGEVKHRGELRPTGDTSYMNLKTQSIKQAAKPTRVTQILDKAVTSYRPRGAVQLAHEADIRKRKEEAKKSLLREDKEIVQARLFAAFEKQQYYNIKDLVRLTNQSIPYLKEILKEICNYCSKSTHKNMWELKPEYRHYKSASSSGSGGIK